MDYGKIYDALIAKAVQQNGHPRRMGHKHPKHDALYFETHHLLARCMGGTDKSENLVYLTARQHVMAHLLLSRIYPQNGKLVHAAWRMVNNRKRKGVRVNSRIAAGLRERFAATHMKDPALLAKHKAAVKAAHNTPEFKAAKSAAMTKPAHTVKMLRTQPNALPKAGTKSARMYALLEQVIAKTGKMPMNSEFGRIAEQHGFVAGSAWKVVGHYRARQAWLAANATQFANAA